MKKIKFNTLTEFIGRSGTGKCSGLILNADLSMSYDQKNKTIEICPITSKGLTGKCSIKVPLNHVQELIDTLQVLQSELGD